MLRTFPITLALLFTILTTPARAEPPPGYYGSVNRNNPDDMRRTLHELIDDHAVYPLESDDTDVWDILQLADENRDNPNELVTVLRNTSVAKRPAPDLEVSFDFGWPRQYGFPNYEAGNIPYTDAHNLFVADGSYKSSRNGWLMAGCNALCVERPTETVNGRGGGSGEYPGNSNWTLFQGARGLWQVWNGRKGDLARAALYMDVRYEGGIHDVLGTWEPDLIISTVDALIQRSRSGQNEFSAYYGTPFAIQAWHDQDPVDEIERQHHETVAAFQGNRNPFIDHPDWVKCLTRGECAPFRINGGIADAWYNPDTAGQGFLVSVLPSFNLMFVAMFTFEVERPPGDVTALIGEAGHRYITAYGPYEGSTANLVIEKTTGGVFGENSPEVDQVTDGTMTIEFGGCDNGTVHYEIPSIGRQGEIPIQRVAKDNVALCEALEQTGE